MLRCPECGWGIGTVEKRLGATLAEHIAFVEHLESEHWDMMVEADFPSEDGWSAIPGFADRCRHVNAVYWRMIDRIRLAPGMIKFRSWLDAD